MSERGNVVFECVSGTEINYTYFCVYMSIPCIRVGSSVFSVGCVVDGYTKRCGCDIHEYPDMTISKLAAP